VVAASLLIVGPNPAQAAADKHGSGQSGNDFGANGSSGQGGNAKRGASNWLRDALNGGSTGGTGGTNSDSQSNLDPPVMQLGTSGGDVADLPVANSEDLAVATGIAPDGQTALRSAMTAAQPIVEQPAVELPLGELPLGGNLLGAAAPRAGSDHSGRLVSSLRSPRVIIGDGRTPGAHFPRAGSAPEAVLSEDSLTSPAAVPAAPAVPTAIEINIPLPPPLPPVERIRSAQLVVGEFGTGTADTVTDPLAGVAGLFLIPAIGAVLGYRQARAAQSLRDSVRT
jgi:hypothetical protein